MKLNSEQISYIEKYIYKNDIKYYEVYMEILDHMILSVEAILEKDKEISFENTVVKAKVEGFGKFGFNGMISERIKFLRKKNSKEFNTKIREYFNFPKTVMTISVFVVYFLFISVFEKPQKAHSIIMILVLLAGLLSIYQIWKFRKKERLFVLKTDVLFMTYNTTMLGFHLSSIIIVWGKESLDFNHFIVRLIFSVLFVFSLLSLLIFIEVRKKTIEELKTQIFV
ncbi:hypothetical protein [Flavobacterium sp.]|uniref:hypothetical protein n=1 Tax=Flavobacterium sp. TaxID=239 RepID=UPI003F6A485C